MKRYNLFPFKVIFSPWDISFILMLILAIPTSNLRSQAIVTSPCSCLSFTEIGRTGEETPISSLSLSPSNCYFVKGTLVINSGTSWTGYRLKMEEGSQIKVVEDLSMTNCYISGCGDMWKGIATVGQTYIHSYNSFIEDAEFGMKLSGLAGLVCLNTHFINNYIGITTADPFIADTEDKVIHRGQVWGCHFYTSSTLPDPYPGQYYYPSWPTTPSETPYNQGFAAIYLSRTVGLNIGYENAEDPDRNKIHDMRNGIILRKETVSDISGTDFYDFEGGIPRNISNPLLDINQRAVDMSNAYSNIKDNTMDNLMVGINGLESMNLIQLNEISLSTPSPGFGSTRGIELRRPQKAVIQQNEINEGMRGVSIEDVTNDFLIADNDFVTTYYFGGINTRILIRNAKLDPAVGNITENTIEVDDATASTGIHLINVNGIIVEDNDIEFLNDENHQTRGIIGVGSFRSTIRGNYINRTIEDVLGGNNGIQLENSGFNTVFCNNLNNFWINLHMFGPNIQTQLVSNELNESEYGFALSSPSMLGFQRHLGNMWPITYGNFGAFIFGTDPDVEAGFSRFFVDQFEDADFMPNPIGPSIISSNVWFINQSTIPATLTCVSEPDPIVDADTISNLILTELDFTDYNDEMTWIIKADVFDMILADPSLTANTVLDSFFDAEETTALGKLVKWQNDLSTRFGEEKSLKSLAQDTISDLASDIAVIDSILALSPVDSASWISLRVLKSDTLEAKVAELKEYLDDEESDSQDVYDEIADSLATLTTTNDLEAYLKDGLSLKAQYLMGSAFSAGDSTDLVDLASLCPWEGNRAQVTGQELYAGIDNQMILPSEDNCPSPSPYISRPNYGQIYEGEVFAVSPNPVIGIADIQSDDVMTNISIFTSDMKSVVNISPDSNRWSVDMSQFPAGVYIFSVTTTSGQFAKRIINMK